MSEPLDMARDWLAAAQGARTSSGTDAAINAAVAWTLIALASTAERIAEALEVIAEEAVNKP